MILKPNVFHRAISRTVLFKLIVKQEYFKKGIAKKLIEEQGC